VVTTSGSAVSVVRPWADAPAPLDALAAVESSEHPFLRLASGGPADVPRWSFLACDPDDVLVVRGRPRPSPDPWRRLAAVWPKDVRRLGPRVPFAGGWAGSVGYEMRSTVEAVPPPRAAPRGFPALFLAHYRAVLAWDPRGRAFLAATASSPALASRAIDALAARLSRARGASRGRVEPPRAARVRPVVGAAEYRRRVASVRERIRRGDLFQANLSQRFEARHEGSSVALFRRLAARSASPFLTYLDLGGGARVLCASPERFLRLAGRRAETRPMKGTRPRGRSPGPDRRLLAELRGSAKDRAELAMIVDLSRNDLGRVCRPGTVRVATARRVERYPTVFQAVGIVVGELEEGRTGLDLLKAAFPPGSVTGAPKVESMRAIDELEGEPRGPYCGAIGWLDEGGDLDLAVAIRTLSLDGPRVSFRTGGGVTLLSDPEAERRETLDKASALVLALGAGGDAR
jgi:para-aminobenzoate synthetase component 1